MKQTRKKKSETVRDKGRVRNREWVDTRWLDGDARETMPVNKRTKQKKKMKGRRQCCVIVIYVADRSEFDSELL